MTIQEKIIEFNKTFGHPTPWAPTLLTAGRATLRYELIREELEEFREGIYKDDLVEIADALGDLVVVVYGAAIEHGIDLDQVVDEIHRSNMTKLNASGKPIHNEVGKIMKGPNYEPPNLRKILGEQGAQL